MDGLPVCGLWDEGTTVGGLPVCGLLGEGTTVGGLPVCGLWGEGLLWADYQFVGWGEGLHSEE